MKTKVWQVSEVIFALSPTSKLGSKFQERTFILIGKSLKIRLQDSLKQVNRHNLHK